MKITLQAADKINGQITAVVTPEDYQEKVKKAIEASSTFKEFRLEHPIEYRAAIRHEDWREKLYQLLPNRFHNPKK